jgi:hypothetical protein
VSFGPSVSGEDFARRVGRSTRVFDRTGQFAMDAPVAQDGTPVQDAGRLAPRASREDRALETDQVAALATEGYHVLAGLLVAAMAVQVQALHHAVVLPVGEDWFKVCACGGGRVWVSLPHVSQRDAAMDPCEHEAAEVVSADRLRRYGAALERALRAAPGFGGR